MNAYDRRMLMYTIGPLPPAATPLKNAADNNDVRFTDVGYGTMPDGFGHNGCLLTLKNYPTRPADGEILRARRRLNSPNLY
jgi:hypothetical protein